MLKEDQFEWVSFYRELATKLLGYKNKRAELVDIVNKIYENTKLPIPTLEKDKKLVDIDPFTFFGLFNKSSMKVTNRNKIISAIADLFNIKIEKSISFDSIPVLNNQNATYYRFIPEREENDIDILWNLFDYALKYSSDPSQANRESFSKYFDLAISLKGNGNSKITMGLYWVAPDTFLNLDSRNEWYIYESGKIPSNIIDTLPKRPNQEKINSSNYLDITEKIRAYLTSDSSSLKNFKELSFDAWNFSTQVNEQNRQLRTQTDELKGAALADEDVEIKHYWIYSPGEGAEIWKECLDDGIMAIGWDEIGDFNAYQSKDEMKKAMKEHIDPSRSFKHAAHATWQFSRDMKPGDIVFAKKGLSYIIGRGVVESDYQYDSNRQHYKNIRKVKWTNQGEWHLSWQASMKALTDITPYTDQIKKLNELFDDGTIGDDEEEKNYPLYNKMDFLREVYIDLDQYDKLVDLVRRKKNVILQGAPGTGKTFAAKRLAYSIMGLKDQDRVMMVQFHQSYSYEDFVMGFRPTENGFEPKAGVFYNFCKKAEIDSDNDYFLIIDEINRGNLSKIFGELFMLIENDKRGIGIQMLYSDEKLSIPENIYIIGMMNTADRSLAMLDYALRRRFAFFDMKPAFNSEGFLEYSEGLANDKFNNLINYIKKLNEEIKDDNSLGEGFCIGHSYFCNLEEASKETLSQIIEFEIAPLLKEYWFDEPEKAKDRINNLKNSIK